MDKTNVKEETSVCRGPSDCCGNSSENTVNAEALGKPKNEPTEKSLNIDLLVIDLSVCKRCVPTGEQLKEAVQLMTPVAKTLGIELRYHEIVVQSAAEAKERALLSSPTIRLNGRDIAQDIRESKCESCGDLTNGTDVDCREWHYRGKVYSASPLPLLVEAIMGAMLKIDEMPLITPSSLKEIPENLQRYFKDKKKAKSSGCCG